MRTTVGPLPSEVYWRRRLAVLLVLVVGLVGLWAYLGGDTSRAGGTPQARPTQSVRPDGTSSHPYVPGTGLTPPTSPAPSPGATPSATPSPAGIASCPDTALQLTVATDARTYQLGVKPRLTMTVRNPGGQVCRRDLGPAARELLITSGAAHTWSSTDCQRGSVPEVALIRAHTAQTYVMTWSGLRSRPGCAGPKAAATAGTYRLRARLGTLRSDAVVFTLH